MKPIDFEGRTHVLAADQPGYTPLPVAIEGNCTTSCWLLSDDEVKKILETKKLWMHQLNFGGRLQPQLPSVERIDPTAMPFGY